MARRFTQQEKQQALDALAAGKTLSAVAADCGISVSTLRRWVKAASQNKATVTECKMPDNATSKSSNSPSDKVQLLVIDTTGEITKISRILHNEGLPVEVNDLPGHPYASFVSDHLPWKSQAYVVDLSKAAARRVFELVRLGSKDLPLILVGSSIQNLYSGKPPVLFYSSVVAEDAMELLGPALDHEYEFSRQQTQIREHDSYVQQFLQCCYGAFDVSPNPIAIINDNGHLYANAAYLQLFNYSAFDQIRDCQFKHLIQEEKQSEFSQALANLDNPCAACTVDLVLQCGSYGTVHITCLPGAPAKYQVVFQSIHSAVTSSATSANDTAINKVASEDPSTVAQQPANQDTEDLAVWTERIVSALSKNRLFSVVYQPIVGLCGDAQNSYEALLRMHDNAGYEHMPASFIPAAEKSGLMSRVDQWVISHVTRVIKESQARDEPLSLFVNLSRDSLFNESFPDWLRETVSDTGIEGTYLTLEVSLDVVLDDLKAARQAMRAIRAVGCRVVLDDYGIESVNAGILRQVSVDFVKVDRKLVLEIKHSDKRLETIKEIVTTANKSGVKTIAGFVQEAQSVSLLWQCGIDYVQGYFLQHPSDVLNYDFGSDEEELPEKQDLRLVPV